jgi:hypothetical protein
MKSTLALSIFAAAFGLSLPIAHAVNPKPDAIKKEIAELKVADVAWRKIPWRTCLLDGLKASREQKKPIIVWAFIDRHIDDKRC